MNATQPLTTPHKLALLSNHLRQAQALLSDLDHEVPLTLTPDELEDHINDVRHELDLLQAKEARLAADRRQRIQAAVAFHDDDAVPRARAAISTAQEVRA